jgi:hypothetical protein
MNTITSALGPRSHGYSTVYDVNAHFGQQVLLGTSPKLGNDLPDLSEVDMRTRLVLI